MAAGHNSPRVELLRSTAIASRETSSPRGTFELLGAVVEVKLVDHRTSVNPTCTVDVALSQSVRQGHNGFGVLPAESRGRTFPAKDAPAHNDIPTALREYPLMGCIVADLHHNHWSEQS